MDPKLRKPLKYTEIVRLHPKAFFQAFALHRQVKEWTLEQAAEAVGTTVEVYKSFEEGDPSDLSDAFLIGLAEAYDLNFFYLRYEIDRRLSR